MSALKLLIWAEFQILVDDSLRTREIQLVRRHAICAKACPYRDPGIVKSVAIEIPALPVLVRLRRHGNLRVDVAAFPFLVPPVDLQRHTLRHVNVDNMELLALPAGLKELSLVVVNN